MIVYEQACALGCEGIVSKRLADATAFKQRFANGSAKRRVVGGRH
jgi:hypothetical protein